MLTDSYRSQRDSGPSFINSPSLPLASTVSAAHKAPVQSVGDCQKEKGMSWRAAQPFSVSLLQRRLSYSYVGKSRPLKIRRVERSKTRGNCFFLCAIVPFCDELVQVQVLVDRTAGETLRS